MSNIFCQCGAQQGYPHDPRCPYPYFRNDEPGVAKWEAAYEHAKAGAQTEPETIVLPDGYNGDVVECYSKPIETVGEMYKLRVVGSTYLIRWCHRPQWEDAMSKKKAG